MYYFRNKIKMQQTVTDVMDGFVRKQRYKTKGPKKVRTGVRLGEVYQHPDGQLFEIVELYGGLCVLAMDTTHDPLAPLDMDNKETGWSNLSAHDFSTYKKIEVPE